MYVGVDLSGLTNFQSAAMTWDFMKRLRDLTKMKIVIKGILAHEDAKLAADAGIDAIIVSNHGARSEDSGRSTIDALPEIIEAVGGRMPVLVDSGFRRGSDIVKALCMGAQGVCIGRPYIWGLGAFGQPGSSACSSCCASSCAPSCSRSARRQSSISRRPWCGGPEKAGSLPSGRSSLPSHPKERPPVRAKF